MKTLLTALSITLLATCNAFSQTATSDSVVVLPASVARKVIQDIKRLEQCNTESIIKDSIIVTQDSTIKTYLKLDTECQRKDSLRVQQIAVKDSVIGAKDGIITVRESEISDLKTQRRWIVGGSAALYIITLLLIL